VTRRFQAVLTVLYQLGVVRNKWWNPLMTTKGKEFIAFVKEYKELIATIAFFVSGSLWVFGYFATKEEFRTLSAATSNQNSQTNCLLIKHFQSLQGRHFYKVYSDELQAVLEDIGKQAPSGVPFLENDIKKVRKQPPSGAQFLEKDYKKAAELDQRRQTLVQEKNSAYKEYIEAEAAISNGECQK